MLKNLKIEINTDNHSVKCSWERYSDEGKLLMQKHTDNIGPTADIAGLEEKYPDDFEKITAHVELARIGYVAPKA